MPLPPSCGNDPTPALCPADSNPPATPSAESTHNAPPFSSFLTSGIWNQFQTPIIGLLRWLPFRRFFPSYNSSLLAPFSALFTTYTQRLTNLPEPGSLRSGHTSST